MAWTAFVAGATGYTGGEVVAALRRRDARTIAHVRPDSASLERHRTRFEAAGAEVETTAWEPDALAERFAELQPTHVFALLGTTRKRAASEGMRAVEAYERVDYGMTAMLIDAAIAGGSKPRFIYLSAAGVSESSRSPYLEVRWRAEKKLRESGLPLTIARPSFIVGREESRPGERFAATVGDGLLAVAGALGARTLEDRYRSTTARELGEALVRLAGDDAFVGRIVHSEELRGDGAG